MGSELKNMSAKELKTYAESIGLVKGIDFQTNASAKDMLELIEGQASQEIPGENQFDEALDFINKSTSIEILKGLTYENEILVENITSRISIIENENKNESINEASKQAKFVGDLNKGSKYEVVTPVKSNGKILVKGESIEFFEGIESLIKDGVIKKL